MGIFVVIVKDKDLRAILRISFVKDFECSKKKKSIYLRHLANQEGQVKVTRGICPIYQSEDINTLK